MARLPSQKLLLLKAALSLRKRNKGLNVTFPKQQYFLPGLSHSHNKAFSQQLGFEKTPWLPYLYLHFQRAQMALITQGKFPVAVPGLLHVHNHMQWNGSRELINSDQIEISVEGECKVLDNGSLDVVLDAEIYSANESMAFCRSGYVKKSEKGFAKKPQTLEHERSQFDEWQVQDFVLPKRRAWDYAKISGDYNPIHLHNGLAKIFGLRKSIVHGWLAVCEALVQLGHSEFKNLDVSFKKPIYWNEICQLHSKQEGEKMSFEIWNDDVSRPKIIGSYKLLSSV